jgi:hypothetical protein
MSRYNKGLRDAVIEPPHLYLQEPNEPQKDEERSLRFFSVKTVDGTFCLVNLEKYRDGDAELSIVGRPALIGQIMEELS